MSIIKHVTLQKIVAHDFRYDLRTLQHKKIVLHGIFKIDRRLEADSFLLSLCFISSNIEYISCDNLLLFLTGPVQDIHKYKTSHWISTFYLPIDAQKSWFKIILKFRLKQLLHVSVQSPSSGSVLLEFAKFIAIKIIS